MPDHIVPPCFAPPADLRVDFFFEKMTKKIEKMTKKIGTNQAENRDFGTLAENGKKIETIPIFSGRLATLVVGTSNDFLNMYFLT